MDRIIKRILSRIRRTTTKEKPQRALGFSWKAGDDEITVSLPGVTVKYG